MKPLLSPASRPDFWRSPLALAGLASLCFLTLLFRLGSYGLVDADEGRYAQIPHEMLARGDWVTPTINGIKFFDKPPLTYWSVMGTYSLLGTTEFAARLAMALFALAGIAATYALGRRAFGPRAGFLSAVILTTTLMWPVMGRVVITDTPLASMTTCALALWWLGHTEKSNRKNFWFALFWVCLGLGVLAKGPVAVVLAFGAIMPYLVWCRPRNGWKMGFAWGVPLLVLVAAPWFVAVALRNPEFNHLFWYKQNFQRFTGGAGVPDHWEAPYYFLPLLPLIFFPWSAFIPRALLRLPAVFRRARTQSSDEAARATVFLVFGALFVLLFFSASKSKIVTYILPMLPLGSALLGAWFDAKWKRGAFTFEATLLSVLALVLSLAAFLSGPRLEKLLGAAPPSSLFVAGGVALAWALALAFCARRGAARFVFGATAGGFALVLASILLFWSSIGDAFTLRALMQPVRRVATPDTRFASVGLIQSLSFYAGKTVLIGGSDGNSAVARELKPGWERLGPQERANFFLNGMDELKRLADEPQPVFIVARSKLLQDPHWQPLASHVSLLASNARYTIYGNDAATALYQKASSQ